MKDKDLHDRLKDLTVRYMELLRRSTSQRGGALPQRLIPKIEFGLNGSMTIDKESKPDFGMLAATTLLDFVNDPSNEAIIKAVLENQSVVRLLKDKGVAIVPMAFAYNILQPMITRQLVSQNGIEMDEAEFDANYQAFEEYLDSEEDCYLFLAPLENFDMETESETVGPLTIRKLTAEEFAAFNGITAEPFSSASNFPFQPYRFVLEMKGAVKRGGPPLTQTYQDRFWWLVAMMKLTKAGSVGYNTVWAQPLSWSGMSFGQGSAYPRHTILGKSVALRYQDLSRLRHYWELVEPFVGRQTPFWMVALQRFCDAVDRHRPDEALLDYWIACESLFGEDIEIGELTYRLSLRIAHFLGMSPVERAKLRDDAKKAYHARGHLLHGARNLDHSKLAAQTLAIGEITRRSLCKCVEEQYQSRDEMIRGIEASIMGKSTGQDDLR